MGCFWGTEPLGCPLYSLCTMEHFGVVLGPFGGHFGYIDFLGGYFRVFWGILGCFWGTDPLGCLLYLLHRMEHFGVLWGPFEGPLGHFKVLGGYFKEFWGAWGYFWGVLGCFWGTEPLGCPLYLSHRTEHFGVVLGPFWGRLRAI